jgi:hypothetical protein
MPMLPSQSTLSRGLCAMTLTLTLGSTLSCATATSTLRSDYGFEVADAAAVNDVDIAWFLIADAATTNYGELAMLNFAVRQINFRVVPTDEQSRITPGILHIHKAPCLADSDLLPVFAAIVGDILKRDVMAVSDVVSEQLQPFCAPSSQTPSLPSERSYSVPRQETTSGELNAAPSL